MAGNSSGSAGDLRRGFEGLEGLEGFEGFEVAFLTIVKRFPAEKMVADARHYTPRPKACMTNELG